MITYGSVGYIFEGLMILFFSYFWVATQFNEIQIADDLKVCWLYLVNRNATSEFLHHLGVESPLLERCFNGYRYYSPADHEV